MFAFHDGRHSGETLPRRGAHRARDTFRPWRLLLIGISVLQWAAAGAAAQNPSAPFKVRMRSASWNFARSLRPSDPLAEGFSLPSLVGAPKSTLKMLLETGTPPTLEEMHGRWRGLNKGVLPAMIGISQFTKEFWTLGCDPHGDNITVCQCDPEAWHSPSAWQPFLENGHWDRHGNYKINCPGGPGRYRHAIELNYGQADNPRNSPERLLVDKVVKLDNYHLLGLAMFQVGRFRVPGFYFVLERVPGEYAVNQWDAGRY